LSFAPEERLAALRELAQRTPDHAPAKLSLATQLVPSQIATYDQATSDEALRAADAGLRLVPNEAAALGVRGLVLERLLRHDEAMSLLDQSSRAE
jgi:hypothetical protein